MTNSSNEEELVQDGLDRIRDGAAFLKISVAQVYALMGQGKIAYVKIGKSRRIPHRALVEFAAQCLVKQ